LLLVAACGDSGDGSTPQPTTMVMNMDACSGAQPSCSSSASYAKDIAPIFQAHCVMCHGAGGVESRRPLDSFANASSLRQDALSQVYRCIMPPAGAGAPLDAATRETLLGWLACSSPAQ
jgi:hypothetical protein